MATRLQLSDIVKSKIDELAPFDGGLTLITAPGNTGNNPIETYIDQFLNESAKETLLEAPVHVLPLTAFAAPVFTLVEEKAVITIPLTYLRVGIIKFSSWVKPVFKAIYPGDPNYSKQFNRWLRGGKARPSATWISESGTGKLVCYGVTSNTGYEAKYVAITVAESMPDILHEPMTWHCAFQVLQVFGKDKLAEMALGRYQKSLSIL
jgi:hypothetical protein